MIKVFNETREWDDKEFEVKAFMGLGNFTNDVILKEVETQAGTQKVVGGFGQSMAFNYWKDGKEQTEFFEVVAWNKVAEALAKLPLKGSRAFVAGKIEEGSYTDKEGVEQQTQKIVIEQFEIVKLKERE